MKLIEIFNKTKILLTHNQDANGIRKLDDGFNQYTLNFKQYMEIRNILDWIGSTQSITTIYFTTSHIVGKCQYVRQNKHVTVSLNKKNQIDCR